jgi:hypothetical protein
VFSHFIAILRRFAVDGAPAAFLSLQGAKGGKAISAHINRTTMRMSNAIFFRELL